jgi:hypothetical protein
MTLPGDWGDVMLSCTANVGGERLTVRQFVPEAVYNDETARKVIEVALRRELMLGILDKWTPVIEVHRGR